MRRNHETCVEADHTIRGRASCAAILKRFPGIRNGLGRRGHRRVARARRSEASEPDLSRRVRRPPDERRPIRANRLFQPSSPGLSRPIPGQPRRVSPGLFARTTGFRALRISSLGSGVAAGACTLLGEPTDRTVGVCSVQRIVSGARRGRVHIASASDVGPAAARPCRQSSGSAQYRMKPWSCGCRLGSPRYR
jgi:hypothetical protein